MASKPILGCTVGSRAMTPVGVLLFVMFSDVVSQTKQSAPVGRQGCGSGARAPSRDLTYLAEPQRPIVLLAFLLPAVLTVPMKL